MPEDNEAIHLPIDTAEVDITFLGEGFTFNHYNTSVFMYAHPYQMVNHVYHQIDDQRYVYIFDKPDLFEQLAKSGFTVIGVHKPTDEDAEEYMTYQQAVLEQDLKEI